MASTYKKIDNLPEFMRWFEKAHPGQGCIYHVGYLPIDRDERDPMNRHYTEDAKEIHRLADAILDLAETRQELFLTQRRIEPMLYEYRATRTSPRSQRKIDKILEIVA